MSTTSGNRFIPSLTEMPITMTRPGKVVKGVPKPGTPVKASIGNTVIIGVIGAPLDIPYINIVVPSKSWDRPDLMVSPKGGWEFEVLPGPWMDHFEYLVFEEAKDFQQDIDRWLEKYAERGNR